MKSIEYLAGLFDGEGSFSIQVSLRQRKNGLPSGFVSPSMSVNLYYGSEVLDHFVEHFGGKIYEYQRGGEQRGRRWHLGKRGEALSAALALQPHLVIKSDIATRFIAALEMFPDTGAGADRRSGERVWQPEQVIAVAEIAYSLNPARSRKCSRTREYLDELRSALTPAGGAR